MEDASECQDAIRFINGGNDVVSNPEIPEYGHPNRVSGCSVECTSSDTREVDCGFFNPEDTDVGVTYDPISLDHVLIICRGVYSLGNLSLLS